MFLYEINYLEKYQKKLENLLIYKNYGYIIMYREIPKEIGKLINLKYLYLNNNQLQRNTKRNWKTYG